MTAWKTTLIFPPMYFRSVHGCCVSQVSILGFLVVVFSLDYGCSNIIYAFTVYACETPGAVKMHYCVWTFSSAMSTVSLIPSLYVTVAPPRHRVYRVRLDVAATVLFVSSPLLAIAPCFGPFL